jgi:hypothetical protein
MPGSKVFQQKGLRHAVLDLIAGVDTVEGYLVARNLQKSWTKQCPRRGQKNTGSQNVEAGVQSE